MRYIDLETYPRRSHFEYFKTLAYPYVGFTANVDVTGLLRFAKERQGKRTLMPLHIQCSHTLVDGYHLGEFYREFQDIADSVR